MCNHTLKALLNIGIRLLTCMSAPKREGGVNETMHEKGGPEVPYNFSGRSIGPKRCLFEMGYLFRRRFMGRFWCSASFTKLFEMERLQYESGICAHLDQGAEHSSPGCPHGEAGSGEGLHRQVEWQEHGAPGVTEDDGFCTGG